MDQFAEYFPAVPTFLFGLCYHMVMVLTRHHVHEKVKNPHQREKTFAQKAARYLFNKLYVYVFSIACIMVFRAIFVLCAPYGKQQFCARIPSVIWTQQKQVSLEIFVAEWKKISGCGNVRSLYWSQKFISIEHFICSEKWNFSLLVCQSKLRIQISSIERIFHIPNTLKQQISFRML